MKKVRIGILTGVFLIALFIGGQASIAAPYKHLTMGDIMSTFEAGWTGGSVVYYQNELTHPAVASVFAEDGPYPGRILPWGYAMEYDVEDAHRISVGVSFAEGYETAVFYHENMDFFFELKGPNDDDYVLLPTKKTAVKQLLMAPGIYAFAFGSFFKQGELPVGEYSLISYDKFFGVTYFYLEIIFYIVPCYH